MGLAADQFNEVAADSQHTPAEILETLSLRADVLADTYSIKEDEMPKGYRDFTGAIHGILRGGARGLGRILSETPDINAAGEAASTFKFYKAEEPAKFFRDPSNYFDAPALAKIYPALAVAQKINAAEVAGKKPELTGVEIDSLFAGIDVIADAAEKVSKTYDMASPLALDCKLVASYFNTYKAEYAAAFAGPGAAAPSANAPQTPGQ